jgi:CheY-like chemotaxis protein
VSHHPPSGTVLRQARTPRVLVVDDDALVAESLRLVLSMECTVEVSLDPVGALDRIRAGETFDVILCDVMMPHMNGIELRGHIEAIARDQAGRMVFVTGGILQPEVRSLLERVPNAWIEKPVDIEGLRELVRRRARTGPPPWQAHLRAI